MELKTLQDHLRISNQAMQKPFTSAADAMLTIVEELGEVAQEIALLEKIGSKAEWEKAPSKDRLAEEMTHVLNVLIVLADLYDIDVDAVYTDKLRGVIA